MNSRRPFKPNLPSAPKPSKLLAPTRLCRTLSSLAYRISQSPITSTKMNWSLLNCFPSTKIPPHWYGYGEIRIWLNVPLKDMTMKRGESRGIWRIKGWRLWMSQSCFSLGFLSQNSLWKLSTYRGYKGIYNGVYEECQKSGFNQTGHSSDSSSQLERAASLSRELTTWPGWKFCPIMLQLAWPFSSPCMLHMCAILVTCQSRDLVARLSWIAHFLRFLYTLLHITFTWFPPKYKVSNC